MASAPETTTPRKVARNTAFQLVTMIMDLGVRTLIMILIARVYGRAGLGQYTFVMTFTTLFMFVYVFGLDRYVIREAARTPEQTGRLLGKVLSLTVLLSVGAMAVQSAAVSLHGYSAQVFWAVVLAAVATVLGGVEALLTAAFYAAERMELETRYIFIERAATFVLLVPLILLKGSLVEIYAVLLVTHVLGVLLCAWFLYRTLRRPIEWSDWRGGLGLLRVGWPFALNALATAMYTLSDVVLLSWYRSDAEAGLYRAGSIFALYLPTLALALGNALMPTMSRSGITDPARFDKALGRAVQWLSATAFPLAIGLAILAPSAIRLFGNKFGPASAVLRALTIVLILRFFSNGLATALTAKNRRHACAPIACSPAPPPMCS